MHITLRTSNMRQNSTITTKIACRSNVIVTNKKNDKFVTFALKVQILLGE